jgi:hypothetical protein
MDARFEIIRSPDGHSYYWRLNDHGEIFFTSGTFPTFDLAVADANAAKAALQAAVAPPGPDIVSIVQAKAVVEGASAPIVNMTSGSILDT